MAKPLKADTKALPKTAAPRRRFTDLFDFAPTGYFVLDRDGAILQVNPAGGGLLDQDRFNLINRQLERFISAATLGQTLYSPTSVASDYRRIGLTIAITNDGI